MFFSPFLSMEVHFDHEKNRGTSPKKTIVVGFGKFNDPNWGLRNGDDDLFFCRLVFPRCFFSGFERNLRKTSFGTCIEWCFGWLHPWGKTIHGPKLPYPKNHWKNHLHLLRIIFLTLVLCGFGVLFLENLGGSYHLLTKCLDQWNTVRKPNPFWFLKPSTIWDDGMNKMNPPNS